MVEWIRKDLGVTSLRYQLLDDMVEAIGLPKERLCLYCWIGKGVQKNLQSYQETRPKEILTCE
jgi:glutamine phosphoribosylpyrophosphate amidotransferase